MTMTSRFDALPQAGKLAAADVLAFALGEIREAVRHAGTSRGFAQVAREAVDAVGKVQLILAKVHEYLAGGHAHLDPEQTKADIRAIVQGLARNDAAVDAAAADKFNG